MGLRLPWLTSLGKLLWTDILGAGAGFQVILLFTILPFDRWHFITVANKADSQVTKKLKKEQPNLPFFS